MSLCHIVQISGKAVECSTLQGTERYAMAVQILLPPVLDLLSGSLTRSPPGIPLCVVLPQRFCEKLLHALIFAIEIEQRPLGSMPLVIMDNDRGGVIGWCWSGEDAADERTHIIREFQASLVWI